MSSSDPTVVDWTRLTDDPNDRRAKAAVRDYIMSIRRVHTDCDLLQFIERLVAGKSVLDIGVAAHAERYLSQPEWRHGRIAKRARRCLGVDIIEPLVAELKQRGFDVVCADATSDRDLGERFDMVFIGDVLEHVTDATRLLRFAARHLGDSGRVFATTPNPFSRKFYRGFRRDGTAIVNLDHVCWITPTQALEIGRRADLNLVAYHLVKKFGVGVRLLKQVAWLVQPLEYSFPDFIYEFG